MKKILNLPLLILVISQFSFTSKKAPAPHENLEVELIKKYHLEKIDGKMPTNVRQFKTFKELDAYLKSRNRIFKASTTAKIIKKKLIRDTEGSSGNTSTSYSFNPSNESSGYASLEFNQFTIDGFPSGVTLSWAGGYASSGIGSVAEFHTKFDYCSNLYDQSSGSSSSSSINVSGDYYEYYCASYGLYRFRYQFTLDATYNGGGINANAVFEPKGWQNL